MRYWLPILMMLTAPAHAQWDRVDAERLDRPDAKTGTWVFTGEGQSGAGGLQKQAYANQAGFGVAPFAVRIDFGNTFCSGALIHPKYVLTAAHCLDNNLGNIDEWTILAGSNTLGGPGQTLTADVVYFHPDWDPNAFSQADLAIIELDGLASPSGIRPSTQTLADGTELRLFGWGLTEDGADPGIQQWGDYLVSGSIWAGQTRLTALGSAGACGGDSGAPYVAFDGSGALRIMAIHSSSDSATCGLSTEWGAVRVDLPANQDFILSVVGNVYDLQYYAHSWRNQNYFFAPVFAAWVGHALQWKAYRSGHAYNPPAFMPSPPIDCAVEPGAVVNDLEVSQFSPSDPAGSWNCWETDSVGALYLAAAYSMFRWDSPAYVNAVDDTTVALTRLTFEVRDSNGDSVPLWFACGWALDGTPMTAQAAADSCDTVNYDIELHAVDYYHWDATPSRGVMCADDFDDTFLPDLDIVFDPPTGIDLSAAPAVSLGEYRAPRIAAAPRAELPANDALPDATRAAHLLPGLSAPPNGGAGFFFSDACTEP